MNNIIDLQNIFQKSAGIKRIGTITEKQAGSVLFQDFQGRTFMASIESGSDVIVGDSILVLDDIVVGKTEIESDPTTYVV